MTRPRSPTMDERIEAMLKMVDNGEHLLAAATVCGVPHDIAKQIAAAEAPAPTVIEPPPLAALPADTAGSQAIIKRESVDALRRVLSSSKSDAAVVAAARELLDRIEGKPRQQVEHSGQVQFQQLIIRRTPIIDGKIIEPLEIGDGGGG